MNFKSDTERQACREKIKWGAVIVAIVLLAVAVAAACTQGFTNANPWGWFGKEKEGQTVTDVEASGGGFIEDDGEDHGIALTSTRIALADYAQYGISPILAQTAYTLTVSYTEEGIAFPDVDYSIAWQNGGSGKWGNGKTVTDYATVTPTADGALTATLTFKKAFGEPIVVTVTNRANTSCTKTATLQYAKRVTGFSQSMLGSGGDTTYDVNVSSGQNGFNLSKVDTVSTTGSPRAGEVKYTYSDVYTKEDTFSVTGTVQANRDFFDGFVAYARTSSYYKSSAVKAAVDGLSSGTGNANFYTWDPTVFTAGVGSLFTSVGVTLRDNGTVRSSMAALFAGYLAANDTNWRGTWYDVTFVVTGTYSTATFQCGVHVYKGAFGTAPTSMSFSQSEFVF